jgi:hypothetical protein
MRHYRLLTLVLVLIAASGATSLIGRSEQAPLSTAPAGPFGYQVFPPTPRTGRADCGPGCSKRTRRSSLALAHGGVWKTANNGTTFEARFRIRG